ncbi:MAG TPA: hypothetical protein VGC67_02765 [Cellulomonas sp.]
MRAPRVLTVAALALGLLAGAASPALADDGTGDGPGSNELDLQVERLDHATQADVVGDEANAMLFSPEDSRAIEAAQAAERARRQDTTRTLFAGQRTALVEPPSSGALFVEHELSTTTTRAAGTDAQDDTGAGTPTVWALAGLALLLVTGIVLSTTVRSPEGPDDE